MSLAPAREGQIGPDAPEQRTRGAAVQRALDALDGKSEFYPAMAMRITAENMPEARLRAEMENPEREAKFLKALDYQLDRNNPKALNVYAAARKLIGSQSEAMLAGAILATVGAVSVEQARRAVAAHQQAGTETEAGLARRSAAFLQRYCQEHGIQGLRLPAGLTPVAEAEESESGE